MDVLDAGVYVSKWQAIVPKSIQVVLWGPLQAREMGFDGWECQDGGETGFIYHNHNIALPAGRAASTLVVVRRMGIAYLTIYLGGYPADVPAAQRRTDIQKVVSAVQLFLTRLSKQTIDFRFEGEIALVDHVNDAAPLDTQTETPGIAAGDNIVDVEPTSPATIHPRTSERASAEIWDV